MSITESQHSIYAYIGQRIRERRKLLRLNQVQIAEMMGFSYQQMQKYENGASQLTAGKLLQFARILNVPPSYFYDGITLDEPIGKRIKTNVIQKVRSGPLRLLLVEDNPADVMLFSNAVDACGDAIEMHNIHDAETMTDFLQNHASKFGRKRPDIIILDLSMPKINGLELLRRIKKSSETLDLPVVILTNSINMKDMTEAYRLGAAGFIQKSVVVEEYMESLGAMLKYWGRVVALPCN